MAVCSLSFKSSCQLGSGGQESLEETALRFMAAVHNKLTRIGRGTSQVEVEKGDKPY